MFFSDRAGFGSPHITLTGKLGYKLESLIYKIYLGVQLDGKLNLKKHSNNLKKKAMKRLNLIKRLASTSWGSDQGRPDYPRIPRDAGGPRASRGLEILEFHVENETKGNERASCGGASEVVGPALAQTRTH